MEGRKKVILDILMEDTGGDLVFKPIEISADGAKRLVETSKNTVIRHNIEESLGKKARR